SKFVLEEFVTQVHQDIYTNKQLRLMIDLKYFEESDEDETTRSIGCVDLFDFDPKNKRAGIGILIADKADRGRGYATEALHLIIDYGFEILDLHQIYSNIRVENESSVTLFKRAGFEVTGLKQDWIYEQGKFYDEYTLQLIKK
ncbi:MAG: GNAT family N-acetyltransferase, partial [Bacteroidota bacterium]